MPSYISKITLPSGTTYDIKDAQAWTDIADIREQLANKTAFHICTSASDTPYGVIWINQYGQQVVGTLTASNVENKSWIYLVPATKANIVSEVTITQDYFDPQHHLKYYSSISGQEETGKISANTQLNIYECVNYNYESDKIAQAVLAYKGSFATDIYVGQSPTECGSPNMSLYYLSDSYSGFSGIQYVNNGIYSEYIVVNQGTDQSPIFVWEKLGDTQIDISNLGLLAFKDSASGQILIPTSASFSGSQTNTGGASASVTKYFHKGVFPTLTGNTTFVTGLTGGATASITTTGQEITVTNEVLNLSTVLYGTFNGGSLQGTSTGEVGLTSGTLPAFNDTSSSADGSITAASSTHTHTNTATGSVSLSTTLTTITVS